MQRKKRPTLIHTVRLYGALGDWLTDFSPRARALWIREAVSAPTSFVLHLLEAGGPEAAATLLWAYRTAAEDGFYYREHDLPAPVKLAYLAIVADLGLAERVRQALDLKDE